VADGQILKSSSALENLQYSSLLNMRQEGLLFVVQWFQSTEFFLCKTGCGTCGQDRQMVSQLCVHLTHIMLRTRKLLRSVTQSRDLHLPLSAGEECCFFYYSFKVAVVYLHTIQKGLYIYE
jgi:hypothetical protein